MIIDIHGHLGNINFAPFWQADAAKLEEYCTASGVSKLCVSSSRAIMYDTMEGNRELDLALKNTDKLLGYVVYNPVFPESEADLELLDSNPKFRGVKIHPDYQETFIDDSGYIEIINSCKELDLIVVTHAGHDVAYRDSMKCPPEKLKKVIEKVGHKKLVLAHLGGSMLIDEVTEDLAGLDVYMDTANDLKFVTKDKFLKLISKHGEDKILFATDMPWSSMKGDIEIVKNFVDDRNALDKIFYKNALSLLSL